MRQFSVIFLSPHIYKHLRLLVWTRVLRLFLLTQCFPNVECLHISLIIFEIYPYLLGASLVAQLGKNLPAVWETWVRCLGWEDPLKKGTATPLQYSGLENSMNCIVHGVAKSRTRPNYFHIYLIFLYWNWLTPYLKLPWKETWHYITLGKAESFFIRRRYHYISNKEYITF